jgi:hypothetical protein
MNEIFNALQAVMRSRVADAGAPADNRVDTGPAPRPVTADDAVDEGLPSSGSEEHGISPASQQAPSPPSSGGEGWGS